MTWGVSRLHVRLAGRPVLVDVDLDIEEGRIAAIVGGDGAGKTTLARVLARLVRHDLGRVSLPDRRHVGYQPASSGSWPDLTVLENLKFVADAHRMSKSGFAHRADELLDATGLAEAVDRPAGHLSGGMRQKLGVAMALVARPKLLVLDEPTTGVDPVSRSELWRLVSRCAADGTGVVITTTYLDEAERASRILALESGRTVASGAPEVISAGLDGTIWAASSEPEEPTRWRRGGGWRVWMATGAVPRRGGAAITPDITDVLTAATMALEVDGR